ncbi:hypothetical protein [Paenibacillus sp. LK1]|uniref:hypothetical protein n=1 Tax=Paenibacillus sp. LK1 TaxID=2053014 RepID=UPI000C1A43B6|nr:hypothetical protein [Paenibacillus sp. LK1]PIH59079.1 hypothetical protein CS562_14140 [Paenibacillus sp. LK1]
MDYYLLHEKQLEELGDIKEEIMLELGTREIEFEIKRSPSSGELFTKFYELYAHQRKDNVKD